MKKLLSIIISLVILTSTSYASYYEENKKILFPLTKEVVLSSIKIKDDFWEKFFEAINTKFNNLRIEKNTNELNNIEKTIEPIIVKYKNKQDNKYYNVLFYMYLRAKLTQYQI